jgi:hypothetical protein
MLQEETPMSADHGRSTRQHETVSRRVFLRRSSQISFAAAVTITAGGALLNVPEAWALDVKGLQPQTMKTLILVARDIYPHDKVPDRYYAIAMKSWDEKAAKDPAARAQMESFIAGLDDAAGKGGYAGLGWESQRVALLRAISNSPVFETIRSGLIVSLYNQPEVWPIFGYEGESYSKGGYIKRGFDDIDWI